MEFEYTDVPNTVYINGIDGQIRSRNGLAALLWRLFGQYGTVTAVSCWPRVKALRGQAWVMFSEPTEAATAATKTNGLKVGRKHIVCALASSQTVDKSASAAPRVVFRHAPPHVLPKALRNRGAAAAASKVVVLRNLPGSTDEKANECATRLCAPVLAAGIPHITRVAPGKAVAFVRFESVEQATAARALMEFALASEAAATGQGDVKTEEKPVDWRSVEISFGGTATPGAH